jgi:hypothetical protein
LRWCGTHPNDVTYPWDDVLNDVMHHWDNVPHHPNVLICILEHCIHICGCPALLLCCNTPSCQCIDTPTTIWMNVLHYITCMNSYIVVSIPSTFQPIYSNTSLEALQPRSHSPDDSLEYSILYPWWSFRFFGQPLHEIMWMFHMSQCWKMMHGHSFNIYMFKPLHPCERMYDDVPNHLNVLICICEHCTITCGCSALFPCCNTPVTHADIPTTTIWMDVLHYITCINAHILISILSTSQPIWKF